MYIVMYKQKETTDFVIYKFETDVLDGTYIDDNGRTLYKTTTKFGMFKFNKITNEFEFIKKYTDSYFISRKKEKMCCWSRMAKCQEKNEFPDIVSWASG